MAPNDTNSDTSGDTNSDQSQSGEHHSWLVKSGDVILGPFPAPIISQKLLSRELVIIDEIALPMGRWKLIRDEPTFAQAVEESRRIVMNNREETEVGGYTTPTPTPAGTKSEVVEVTPAPVAVHSTSQNASLTGANAPVGAIRDAEYVEGSVDVAESHSTSASETPTQYKQFGVRGLDRHSPKSMQSIVMWAVAVCVVVGAGVTIFNMKKPASERGGQSVDFDRTVANAERAWARGDFSIAEKTYLQANRLRPLKVEVVARLAPLLIQLEGQTVEAKRLLSDTRNSEAAAGAAASSRLASELQLGTALASMFSMEYAEAEGILKNARSDANVRFISDFNLGMLAFIAGQYEEATRLFSLAGDVPIALFMKTRSLASMPKKRGGRKEAAALLLNLTKNHFDYYQEAQLLSAALLLESGNKKGALNRVRLVLDADPEMTANHWHDPLLFQNAANWKALTGVCRRLHEGLKASPSRALLALCLSKAGQAEDAMRTLNEGLASSGDDPLLQAVNAQLLYNSNRDDDARAALRMALRQEPYPILGRMVKARLCLRRNEFACAEEEWKILAGSGTQRLTAITGLAQINAKKGNQSAADELISRALTISSRYRPALRLRDGVLN